MLTVALKIFVEDAYQEFLIAELSDLDFESFEQGADYLVAYIPSPRWDDTRRERIEQWLAAHQQPTGLKETIIRDQNWNQLWEETIAPTAIPPFLVKPTWRETPAEHRDLILLEIDPKMSFGTGYHETTRLMLRLIPDYLQSGDRVLDAGTGSGILAIACAKLGCSHVDAFDVDEWSQRNALENVYLNGVEDEVDIFEGGIDVVPKAAYEIILANINRNVIIGLLDDFRERLARGGKLLVSGVLLTDRDRLLEEARTRKLSLRDEQSEGEWWAGVLA